MASEELDALDGALGDVHALALSLQMAGQGEAALMLANAHQTILQWAIEREDQVAVLTARAEAAEGREKQLEFYIAELKLEVRDATASQDAAPSPIWERMEQNSATVAAMPDYVKGSPKNERAAPSQKCDCGDGTVVIYGEGNDVKVRPCPRCNGNKEAPSPRAWVCVEDPNGDHGIYLDGDTVMMRLLPLPTAKELGKVAWKWGTNMQGTDEQFEKLGAVLYWALGVSDV